MINTSTFSNCQLYSMTLADMEKRSPSELKASAYNKRQGVVFLKPEESIPAAYIKYVRFEDNVMLGDEVYRLILIQID